MRSTPRPALAAVAAAALLVALLGVAYSGSLPGGFLWDDDLHITANPTVVGPLGLKEIWTSARANYFPLVLTHFRAQHALWGLDPLGYRVVTLLCHAAAALLLWRVLRRLAVPGAWLGAALWALHPVQVESVAWICELKNTQSAVFFLLAIWAWLRAPDAAIPGSPPAGRWYAFALGAAFLAILSKPSTVMLPVVLGLLTWWRQGRVTVRDVLRLGPFLALSALAAGWTIWEQKFNSGALGPEWAQTWPERLVIAGRACGFYLGKLLWPAPLIFIYPRWEGGALSGWAWMYPLVVAVALGWLGWRAWAGRDRGLFMAAAYFVALLFPVLGFFSVYFFRYSFVGDHFQYLASMGPLALLAAGTHRVLAGRVAAAMSALLLLALGGATFRHARHFTSPEALWSDTVAKNPAAAMAWLNLADTHARAGRYTEAITTYERAIAVRPADPDGWNDLGNVLVLTGRPDLALPRFVQALALKPAMAAAWSNQGNALRDLGRIEEALASYRRALELDPRHPGALNNLGAQLAELGQAAEALGLFERARNVQPGDPATLDNVAGALRELGRHGEALALHAEVLRLRPGHAEFQASHGRTLLAAGRPAEACAALARALELQPALGAARNRFAQALAAAGRGAEVLGVLERGVEVTPDAFDARLNYGTALAQAGRADAAVIQFERAAALRPGSVPAWLNLGTAHAAQRKWEDAARAFAAAVEVQPDAVDPRMRLAVALVNAGRLADAVPHLEEAIRLRPGGAEAHDTLGQVLGALGRRREALGHLEEAARLRREPRR